MTVLRLFPVLVWVAPGVLVIIFFFALRVNRLPSGISSVDTLTILLTLMLSILWVAAAFIHLPHLYIKPEFLIALRDLIIDFPWVIVASDMAGSDPTEVLVAPTGVIISLRLKPDCPFLLRIPPVAMTIPGVLLVTWHPAGEFFRAQKMLHGSTRRGLVSNFRLNGEYPTYFFSA